MTTLLKERMPTSDIIYEQQTPCKNLEGIAQEYLLVPVEKSTSSSLVLKVILKSAVKVLTPPWEHVTATEVKID